MDVDEVGIARRVCDELLANRRLQVTITDPVSIFPYSTAASRRCDLDHTEPYDRAGPTGQTRPANLGPVARPEHRGKTHGGWLIDQIEPGEYLWQSPLGYRYLVDRGGTHRSLDLSTFAMSQWTIDADGRHTLVYQRPAAVS